MRKKIYLEADSDTSVEGNILISPCWKLGMEGTVKTKRVAGIALEKSGKIRRRRPKPWCSRAEHRNILKKEGSWRDEES